MIVEVAAAQWVASATALRGEGCPWFGLLTAVDDPAASTLDVVLVVGGAEGVANRGLRCTIDRADPCLDSVAGLWPGAGLAEREVHEMFGVRFIGNDDLRPLLLPAGVTAAPLRRDAGLGRRASTEWPGAVEPGDEARARRRPVRPVAADPTDWVVEL